MNYQDQLSLQVTNSKIPTASTFLTGLYGELAKELSPTGLYLEIGAGAGISSSFLHEFQVTRTDILPWGDGLVIGGINAEDIPFEDASYNGVFGMDMLHHMEYPLRVIKECLRLVEKDGKIVFIEPYVSLFSYAIYRLFHTEKTSLFKVITPNTAAIGRSPEDGDQRICQAIFLSRSGKSALEQVFGRDLEVQTRFIHPLSFFMTGGLSRPLKTNPQMIRAIQKIERNLPRWLLRLSASRIVVVITKNSA